MSRTRVKICGITRPEDGLHAASQGADAIGLVFYAKSPRAVNIEQAKQVSDSLPPFVSKVGLFVNAEKDEVLEVLSNISLDVLQFHGDEAPEYCRQFKQPYLKAIRMHEDLDLLAEVARYSEASGILLDAYKPGVPGGTGEQFDWSRIPMNFPRPLILAGGLTPRNVAEAIKTVRPYAVDVSGGVESSKGIKDADKITAFMKEVK